MKRLIIIIILSASVFCKVTAQETVTFNISQQPAWGPVGYDFVDYYYIPDIGVYYNVPTHQFTYWENEKWTTTNTLPSRYANFNLFAAHKVVINKSNEPWLSDNENKIRYAGLIGQHDQVPIRDSHEEKYWENPDHPEHGKWHAR